MVGKAREVVRKVAIRWVVATCIVVLVTDWQQDFGVAGFLPSLIYWSFSIIGKSWMVRS